MKHTIKLPEGNEFTGLYLSLQFVNGIAQTDGDFIADKARNKGYAVETQEPAFVFKCPYCTVTCKSEENLQKHIQNKHKDKADELQGENSSADDGADADV